MSDNDSIIFGGLSTSPAVWFGYFTMPGTPITALTGAFNCRF